MTEDEAKTKLCCGPRVMAASVSATAPKNTATTAEIEKSFLCCGASCMAWHVKEQIGIGPNGQRRSFDTDGLTRWVDDGYCGLAGLSK